MVHHQEVLVQFQTLGVIYCLALATAAILLRPIRSWQELPERFQEPGETDQRFRFWNFVRFLLGMRDDM